MSRGHEQHDDAELIERCRSATQAAHAAFDELYGRHAGAVYGFLRGMHRGDEHAARDALQETFLRFYRSLERFDGRKPVRPWLLRIARNVSLDVFKKRSHDCEEPRSPETFGSLKSESSDAPDRVASRREAVELMRGAIARMPESERAVFLLKHDQGLTYSEVAEALGCSLRTAKYRMKSALELLGREAERLGVSS